MGSATCSDGWGGEQRIGGRREGGTGEGETHGTWKVTVNLLFAFCRRMVTDTAASPPTHLTHPPASGIRREEGCAMGKTP